MSELRAHVALMVDGCSLRWGAVKAAPAKPSGRKKATPADDEAAVNAAAGAAAKALITLATRLGRVALARAYADWTRDPETTREVQAARLEPILVPPCESGVDRSAMRLAVEALESLYAGDEPDAFVLASTDPTLLPLLQALKADGSEVVLVAPEDAVPSDLREEADRFLSLESVLTGVDVEPVQTRARRGSRGDGGGAEPARARAATAATVRFAEEGAARRDRQPHPTPVRSDEDFSRYDWAPFIRLIDELERRLPFVGVRYLVNKVLGPHNCGVDDPRLKRDLMNRAVDDGLLEMYPVGNVGDRADPVTACRLDRRNAEVVRVLGSTTAPVPPTETPSPESVSHAADSDDLDG